MLRSIARALLYLSEVTSDFDEWLRWENSWRVIRSWRSPEPVWFDPEFLSNLPRRDVSTQPFRPPLD
jgi:hypothetical protein